MAAIKSILFIMADHLWADYLSCEGIPRSRPSPWTPWRNGLGDDPKHARIRNELYDRLFKWPRNREMYITAPYQRAHSKKHGLRYSGIINRRVVSETSRGSASG